MHGRDPHVRRGRHRAGNVLGLAACVVFPAIGFVRRIPREEALLRRELGEPYAEYAQSHAAPGPGVWAALTKLAKAVINLDAEADQSSLIASSAALPKWGGVSKRASGQRSICRREVRRVELPPDYAPDNGTIPAPAREI